MALTNIGFARSIAYLSKTVSEWAGDTLERAEHTEAPADPAMVERFCDAIRERLAFIEELARQPPRGPKA